MSLAQFHLDRESCNTCLSLHIIPALLQFLTNLYQHYLFDTTLALSHLGKFCK